MKLEDFTEENFRKWIERRNSDIPNDPLNFNIYTIISGIKQTGEHYMIAIGEFANLIFFTYIDHFNVFFNHAKQILIPKEQISLIVKSFKEIIEN